MNQTKLAESDFRVVSGYDSAANKNLVGITLPANAGGASPVLWIARTSSDGEGFFRARDRTAQQRDVLVAWLRELGVVT